MPGGSKIASLITYLGAAVDWHVDNSLCLADVLTVLFLSDEDLPRLEYKDETGRNGIPSLLSSHTTTP